MIQEGTHDQHLPDEDEDANVGFVKDHEGLYNKTNKHFKDKARQEFLLERFANSHKLSVEACKTWFCMLRQADAIEVWTGPERDDGTSELDTG